jgi:NB-ARC domain
MAREPIKKTFGSYLLYFRNQTKSENGKPLSQEKMAEAMKRYPGIIVSRDQIYKWEKDKSEMRPAERKELIAIIQVLVEYGGIKTILEANLLINAGGLKNLEDEEISQINFINPVQNYFEQMKETEQKLTKGHGDISYPGGNRNRNFDPINYSRVDQFYNRPPGQQDELGDFPINPAQNSQRDNSSKYRTNAQSPRPGLAPILPSLFLGRNTEVKELKERLNITHEGEKKNIQVITAMRGWPGVGKTTTAAALAYEDDVIQKFPDGVLWTSLGPTPNLLANLVSWGKALGNQELLKAKNIIEASGILAAYLRDKHMFLIIDDVWNATDAEPFIAGGHKCAILITTRLPAIAAKIVSSPEQIYLLGVLAEKDSIELLRTLAPQVVLEHPEETKNLAGRLEGLPLALQVAGRLLQSEYSSGFSVNDLIEEISNGKRLLSEKAPVGQESLSKATTPTIAALLYKSLDHLDALVRDHYALLGAFAPSPAQFDLRLIEAIWQTPNPRPIIKILVDHGLLEYIPQSKRYQMHSLLVMLAKSLWKEEDKPSRPKPKV